MRKIEESVRTALQFFDCINSKSITRLMDIIDDKCVFDDLWEQTHKCIDKNEIAAYFSGQFKSTDNIKIKVIEVNNFGHKCIVKFKLSSQGETDTRQYECLGLFEVYSGLIISISFYGKK
jgi:hypothetical protein